MNDGWRALLAALAASAVVVAICSIAYAIVALPGFPMSFGTSVLGIALGLFLVGLGLLWACWVFVYRSPKGFFLSTFYTFKKMLTRTDPGASLGRSEPFVVDGPYLYVRNPTYFGACLIVLGCSLTTGLTFLIIASAGLCLWFNLVIMPYEKREMQALFGQDYITYTRMVPSFIPSGRVVYGRSKRRPVQ